MRVASCQRRTQARLWLEGIFTDGALNPFITRYVGAAYLNPQEALQALVGAALLLSASPIVASVAAISVGVVQGTPLVSLQPRSDYTRAVAAWAADWSGQPMKDKSIWQRLRKK